jgi:predicted nucleotidyltransferase
VAHVALFGSRGRGDARAGSDLDVLIDVDPGTPKFSLLDLAGVCGLLTETIAIERQMLARDPRFAKRIAPDIVEVF